MEIIYDWRDNEDIDKALDPAKCTWRDEENDDYGVLVGPNPDWVITSLLAVVEEDTDTLRVLLFCSRLGGKAVSGTVYYKDVPPVIKDPDE